MGTLSIHFSINVFLLYIEVQYFATGWMVWGLNPGSNKRLFFLQKSASSGDHPASSMGASFLSQGKAARAQVNHSPPS